MFTVPTVGARFTALQPFTLGGTIVNLYDLTNAFTGESLLSFSGISGFSAANVSLNMGTLLVDLIGTEGSTGATIDIALANTAVPEPTSASLIATGLIAFAMVRRRRRAQDQAAKLSRKRGPSPSLAASRGE